MNTTLPSQISSDSTRDRASEFTRTTMGRTAPRLVIAASAALAALAAVGVYAWQAAGPDTPASPPSGATSSPSSASPASEPTHPRLRTVDRRTFDLDADNFADLIALKIPVEGTGPARVVVRYGNGERSVLRVRTGADPTFTGNMGGYDESGVRVVVIESGGGDGMTWAMVAQTEDGLARVRTVDASGAPAALQVTAESPGWNTREGAVFTDYRFPDGPPAALPAPVELRRWVLEGTTLTRTAQIQTGCWIRFDNGGVGPVQEPCD